MAHEPACRRLEVSEIIMKLRQRHNTPVPDGDLLVLEEGAEDGTAGSGESPVPAPVDEAPARSNGAPTTRPRGLLGEVLVAQGLVTDAQVATALKQQTGTGKRLGEVLVDMGALDERGLVDALADFFGMPVTDLRRDTPAPDALALDSRGDGP